MHTLAELLAEVRACTVCEAYLPNPPKPVLLAGEGARLLIVGQAPGQRVHETGIPWNDPSGDNLRSWLAMSREEFYDIRHIALIPTAFCYPGKGKHGDLPPRPECAPLWHPRLLAALPDIRLILLVGSHAQAYYLRDRRKPTLAQTVKAWHEYLPRYFPLPHPSPRNRLWLKRHPWFETEVLPALRSHIRDLFTLA